MTVERVCSACGARFDLDDEGRFASMCPTCLDHWQACDLRSGDRDARLAAEQYFADLYERGKGWPWPPREGLALEVQR